MKRMLVNPVLIVILSIIMVTSCAVKQEVYIEKSGNGEVSFDIQLADYLTEVIGQVMMLLEPGDSIPENQLSFFDLEAIENDFRQREGITLVSLEAPAQNRITGQFTFEDPSILLQSIEEGSAESQIVQMRNDGRMSELTVRLNRNTITALLDENPSFNNALVETFGPAGTEGLTEEEYLDMMAFALGEVSRVGIQSSSLDLTIRVEGQIIDQKGGRIINKNTVKYSIPLLPVLMLTEPLEYSVSYQ